MAIVDSKIESIVVESTKEEPIVITTDTGLVSNIETYTVVVEVESTNTLVSGMPGPQGPPGISEDAMAYASQIDFVGEDVIYKGEAEAGTLKSAPAWRIRKITITNDDVSEIWADGNTNFDNIWDNRASLTYT